MIVAIDGPAGVGKSTVAKLLASRLGFLYLDTGALYRSVGLAVLHHGIQPGDETAVGRLLPKLSLKIEVTNNTVHVSLNGKDVTGELRTPAVSAAASIVSAIPAVRAWLLPVQRQIGQHGSVVAEGRDVGTKVFPAAPVKFFLEADPTVRAERRHRVQAQCVAGSVGLVGPNRGDARAGRARARRGVGHRQLQGDAAGPHAHRSTRDAERRRLRA